VSASWWGGQVDREHEPGCHDLVAQCGPGVCTDAIGRDRVEPEGLRQHAELINPGRCTGGRVKRGSGESAGLAGTKLYIPSIG
jgi:hypothetical protein